MVPCLRRIRNKTNSTISAELELDIGLFLIRRIWSLSRSSSPLPPSAMAFISSRSLCKASSISTSAPSSARFSDVMSAKVSSSPGELALLLEELVKLLEDEEEVGLEEVFEDPEELVWWDDWLARWLENLPVRGVFVDCWFDVVLLLCLGGVSLAVLLRFLGGIGEPLVNEGQTFVDIFLCVFCMSNWILDFEQIEAKIDSICDFTSNQPRLSLG